MRILLAFLLAILPLRADIDLSDPAFLASLQTPAAGGAVWTYAGVSASAGAFGNSTTAAIDTTGASLLVLVVSWYNTAPTISDSAGNTWTAGTSYTGDLYGGRIYFCASPMTSATHTFSSSGGEYSSIVVAKFTGAGGTTDVENGVKSVSNTTQPGSVTPSQADSLVISAITFDPNNTPSIDSGFTIIATEPYSVGTKIGAQLTYKVKTSASAENPTFSMSGLTTTVAVSLVIKQ